MFSVLKPVLYFGLCLGLIPYSINKGTLFIPASVYSLVLIFILWQSCMKTLTMALDETINLFSYGYVLPLQIFLNTLITYTSWLAVLYRHQLWIKLFEDFSYIEKESKVLKEKVKNSAAIVVQIIGIMSLVFVVVVYYFSFYYKLSKIKWIITIGQTLSTAVNILILTEFLTYIIILNSYFSVLNRKLTELLEYEHYTFDLIGFVEKPESLQLDTMFQLIRSVREIHGSLCSLCKHVNKSYGAQLLVSVCKAILLITVILYTVSLTFLGKEVTSDLELPIYLTVMVVVLLHNTAELLLLVFICSSVSEQVNTLNLWKFEIKAVCKRCMFWFSLKENEGIKY